MTYSEPSPSSKEIPDSASASAKPSLIVPGLAKDFVTPSGRSMTGMIGNPNLRANSKSRSSWDGTAMMAPVP